MSGDRIVAGLVYAKEEVLRPLPYESAFVVDDSGNILLEKKADPGTLYELTFTEEEIALIKAAQGVVFTHNHPHGWKYDVLDPRHAGYSFSPDDIYLACKGEIAEMRAVSPRYRFSMKPPTGGWNEAYWQIIEPVFQIEYAAVNRNLTLEVLRGRLRPAQLQAELLHVTWMRVAVLLGLAYNRWEE